MDAAPPAFDLAQDAPAAFHAASGCALPSLTHLDLFSGIGGFALAARMVGQIETVAFCEREAYAQRVLKKHWPDVPICDDIHTLKGNDYGPIDLITGGFPCQPYSLAGKRGGNDDDRALWPQMLRVIREARPTWIIGENVPGIISMALDGVLADLEREGYACETFAIPACAVDAKHRRNRIWIVANSSGGRCCGKGGGKMEQPGRAEAISAGGDVAHGESLGRRARRARGSYSSSPRQREQTLQDVADAQSGERRLQLSAGHENQGAESHGRREAVSVSDSLNGWAGTRRQNGAETSDGCRWLPEPDVGRVAHGIPSRVDRLKGLGNAIVPQVAAALLAKIVEVHYGTVAWHNDQRQATASK